MQLYRSNMFLRPASSHRDIAIRIVYINVSNQTASAAATLSSRIHIDCNKANKLHYEQMSQPAKQSCASGYEHVKRSSGGKMESHFSFNRVRTLPTQPTALKARLPVISIFLLLIAICICI